MKSIFKGFYNIEETSLEELWKDEKTIFVFDTNVLLNLYGYAKQTRDDFFNILEELNEKLWIPYHVGLEYQRRRLNIISREKVIFNDIERNLEKIQNVFKGDFKNLALKRRFPKLSENTEKLEREIKRSISNYKKSVQHWDSAQPCVRSHDEIRDKLNNIFNGKVGEQPKDQKWLDNLYKIGQDRFTKKIPPGFKDDVKGKGEDTHFYNDGLYYERKYGDLILWMQLIEKAKSEHIKNVIFITDDAKEDWWYKIKSNGTKIIGPLAELQSEIYRESKIDNFHMYSTSMFLEDGKSNLSVSVSKSSIEEADTTHVISETKKRNNYMNLISKLKRYQGKSTNSITSSINDERYLDLLDYYKNLTDFDENNYKEIIDNLYKKLSIYNALPTSSEEKTNIEDDCEEDNNEIKNLIQTYYNLKKK